MTAGSLLELDVELLLRLGDREAAGTEDTPGDINAMLDLFALLRRLKSSLRWSELLACHDKAAFSLSSVKRSKVEGWGSKAKPPPMLATAAAEVRAVADTAADGEIGGFLTLRSMAADATGSSESLG